MVNLDHLSYHWLQQGDEAPRPWRWSAIAKSFDNGHWAVTPQTMWRYNLKYLGEVEPYKPKPYMGQSMAECGCDTPILCRDEGRCVGV